MIIVSKEEESHFIAGEAVPVGSGAVSVQRILAGNASMMTGPGTNSYLLGNQELALVDPGPNDPAHVDALLRHIGSRELKWIFVTHTHGDHSPAAAQISAQTGARLIGLQAPEGSGQDPSFKPSGMLEDGESIACGSFNVSAHFTPGHVSNHVCFLLEEEQMLFTGDHILEGTTPVILPPYGHMGQYLASLEKVRDLNVRSLAPGHGSIMDSPQTVIDTLVRHRLRRESKIKNALKAFGSPERAVTLDALTKLVYDDVPQRLHVWASKTLLAHLIKLQDEGWACLAHENWYCLDE
ncbi:MAG: MBL fold metallo-hydrolase [Pseudohongiellaceae bacterium]|nr:MBL fold metallo-hydrolase [Pseudohongiellaceae bacterium]